MRVVTELLAVPGLPGPVARSFRSEQLTELTMPVALSLIEGGFAAVVAAKTFDSPPWLLAVISASPMFGNLSSFLWNRVATARSKVPMVVTLQALVLACVLAVAFSPRSMVGASILVGCVIIGRLLVAGVITARSVTWSLNYGRNLRARVTSRLQLISSFVTVLTTSVAGMIFDAHPENYRILYAVGAVVGAVGAWSFSRVTVQGELRHRVLERKGDEHADGRNGFFRILMTDRLYARYQLHQFTSGVAAMMLEPALVYLVSKQLGASYLVSIGIVMIIPFAMNVLTLPLWGHYLDRVHVAEFRARQNALWTFGVLVMFWGALTGSLAWLAAGRVINGIVGGGGSLAWQLGHNDFAPRDQLAAYMGIHVTLTGVRGAFAPFLGMALYLGWQAGSVLPGLEGLGPYLFVLSAGLGVFAWRGFNRLRYDVRHAPGHADLLDGRRRA
jgi:MFS family permease